MSIELSFLTKLIETGDWSTVDELQIKQKYFYGKNRRMFKWIQDFKTKYGKVPSIQEFKKKFRDFEPIDSPEVMRYYCDEVRNKMKHNTIVDGFEEAQEHLNDFDTEQAYGILKNIVYKIENEIVMSETKKLNEDTSKRWEQYLERKNFGGISGIPTNIIPLDMMLGGVKATDLITILGFTGTGKTWALAILSCNFAKAGYKTLFITREMNSDQMMKRIDALWAGISYERWNKGRLYPDEEAKMQKSLASTEGKEVDLIVELSTGGLTNVSAMIDKHQPDVVLVDGGYLMTEDEDDDDWKGVMKVWRGFKNIALQKKVPFIVTSQLKEGDKVSLSKISFAKALANECDSVIALEQDDQMRDAKEIKWKPLKLRDAEMSGYFLTKWDFNEMNYQPIFSNGKVNPTGEKPEKQDAIMTED